MSVTIKTEPVIIATSGPVPDGEYDGRTIERAWLEDFVKNFNPKVFVPKIYSDHKYHSQLLGTVDSIYLEEATEPELKGEVHLYAVLCPNQYAIYANRQGEFKYSSIEVGLNYRGTGEFYLEGLCFTNEPASAGVSELNFSKRNKKFYTREKEIQINLVEVETKTKFSKRIADLFKTKSREAEEVTPEELKLVLDSQSEQIQNMFEKTVKPVMEEFNKVVLEFGKFKASQPNEDDQTNDDDQQEEQPSKTEFDALKKKFDDLNTSFEALKNTPSGQTAIPEGETEDDSYI